MGRDDQTAEPQRPCAVADPAMPEDQRERLLAALDSPHHRAGNPVLRALPQIRPLAAAAALVFLVAAFPAGPGLRQVLTFVGVLLMAVALAPVARAARSAARANARARLIEAADGGYILPSDLDQRGRELLARAQRAIDTVMDAEVVQSDVLDSAKARVDLTAIEWDLARMLHRQSRVRSVQPDLAALTDAEREAAAVVHELERYAERVTAADLAQVSRDTAALENLGQLSDYAAALARRD